MGNKFSKYGWSAPDPQQSAAKPPVTASIDPSVPPQPRPMPAPLLPNVPVVKEKYQPEFNKPFDDMGMKPINVGGQQPNYALFEKPKPLPSVPAGPIESWDPNAPTATKTPRSASLPPSKVNPPQNIFLKYHMVPPAGDGSSVGPNEGEGSGFGMSLDSSPMARVARRVDDTVRNFANSVTFGGIEKLADWASGAPSGHNERLTDEAMKRDPAAGMFGKIAGTAVPGELISRGIGMAGKAIGGPLAKLGGNNLVGIGANQALTGAAMSAIDDAARTGEIDPYRALTSAGFGAAIGPAVSVAARGVSPSARVRAYGDGLSEAEKAAMSNFASDAAKHGVSVNIPEAATAAVPTKAARLNAAMDSAVTSPAGSQNMANFNAKRLPEADRAMERMAEKIGPKADPFDVADTARAAIDTTKNLIKESAKPYYNAASNTRIPKPDSAAYRIAASKVKSDPVKMERLAKDMGVPQVDENTIGFWDQVSKQLRTQADEVAKTDPFLSAAYLDEMDNLSSMMEKADKNYATARDISRKGAKQVDRLEAGPLGKSIENPTVEGQSAFLFGPTNSIDMGVASNAMKRLRAADPNVDAPRGVLANKMDMAISTKSDPFPTPQSKQLAQEILGPDFAAVDNTIRAKNAINPRSNPVMQEDRSGPLGQAWSALRDYGRGDVVNMLNDPALIPILGTIGPTQRASTMAANASNVEMVKNKRDQYRSNQRKKEAAKRAKERATALSY